jgi:putative transport protein
MSAGLDLFRSNPTAQAIAILSLVCTLGMAGGGIKVRGVSLGTSAVLFAGIAVGAISKPINEHTLEFAKELGLLLFVYCMGLQLGPGFFASLRKMGLRLNALAAVIVLLGAGLAVLLGRLLNTDPAATLGLFSGATTNTPSLGAAQQTLTTMPGLAPERAALPALAYAVSYPVAIPGIIATMLALKRMFHIDPPKDAESYAGAQRKGYQPPERRTLVIDNPNLEGSTIESLLELMPPGLVVSRVKGPDDAEARAATSTCVLHRGTYILVVGTPLRLDQCQRIVGHSSEEDLAAAPGEVTFRRLLVTNRAVLGKTLQQLEMRPRFGVTVTRTARAGLETTAVPNLPLQFGDVVQVVGDEPGIAKAAALLGDSVKALNETQFVSLFAGMVVGVALGMLPLSIPGLPQPLRLGLAGGPLIVAILVSRVGRIGPLVWHMPLSANVVMRELGIAMFFASVGLLAGPRFFEVVFSREGLVWMAIGACVTVLPIFAIGAYALAVSKASFVVVTGLLAGSMTDPPALAFATNICDSESPTVAYATVYPLTTMLRIMTAQVLAVLLCG